jgi:hypothetical protein
MNGNLPVRRSMDARDGARMSFDDTYLDVASPAHAILRSLAITFGPLVHGGSSFRPAARTEKLVELIRR